MSRADWIFGTFAAGVAALIAGWILFPLFHTYPMPRLDLTVGSPVISPYGSVAIPCRGCTYVTAVDSWEDEVFAYLMFSEVRSSGRFDPGTVWLRYDRAGERATYTLVAGLSDDAVTAVQRAARWRQQGLTREAGWRAIPDSEASRLAAQSRLFTAAYSLPVRNTLEKLPPDQVKAIMNRFIRFKSAVDPRVQKKLYPVPQVLDRLQAERLAGDILTVAQFFEIPLDVFLGIGAVENNYMNVRGDLTNSRWKRRPEKDDIILERRKGRVRVLNDSAGVWQITRETLRYSHRLYLRDDRDYSALPEHLRPPKDLVMNELSPEVLTTYAGLLLRDLLDTFDGDVRLAVGAYNGGVRNPNMKYEQWVRNAASHARSVVERSAALNGESVMERTWLTSPPL